MPEQNARSSAKSFQAAAQGLVQRQEAPTAPPAIRSERSRDFSCSRLPGYQARMKLVFVQKYDGWTPYFAVQSDVIQQFKKEKKNDKLQKAKRTVRTKRRKVEPKEIFNFRSLCTGSKVKFKGYLCSTFKIMGQT